MNQGIVVRWEATDQGVWLKLWIDSERGKHVATAELRLTPAQVSSYAHELGVQLELARANEEALFDV